MAERARRDRRLDWDGCWNVRDLGGLPAEDGLATRFGVVVRGDDVSHLSPAGWTSLAAYGVRRSIDLRHEDPPYEAPVEVTRTPLVDDGTFREIDELLAGVDDPVDRRRRNYRYLLDRHPAGFGRAISAVAADMDGTVVVHCAGGVDRTGSWPRFSSGSQASPSTASPRTTPRARRAERRGSATGSPLRPTRPSGGSGASSPSCPRWR